MKTEAQIIREMIRIGLDIEEMKRGATGQRLEHLTWAKNWLAEAETRMAKAEQEKQQ